MRLQRLQSRLHRGKRRTTNHVTQTINHQRTRPQRSNHAGKLLHQQIRRPNIPRHLAGRPLPLHTETVNKPHLPLLKILRQSPAKHSHLRYHILPRPSSDEIDTRPALQQTLVEDLLRTYRHTRIRLAQEQDYAPPWQTTQRIVKRLYPTSQTRQTLHLLALPRLVLVPRLIGLLRWRVYLPLNCLFHYLLLLGYGQTSSDDFFEAWLSGPDAFSPLHGGVFGRGSRFEPQWDL